MLIEAAEHFRKELRCQVAVVSVVVYHRSSPYHRPLRPLSDGRVLVEIWDPALELLGLLLTGRHHDHFREMDCAVEVFAGNMDVVCREDTRRKNQCA
jgi:hypothetical protein